MTDLIIFELGERRITVQDVVRSSDVAHLDQLATAASVHGAQLEALSYLSAFQIYSIFKRVSEVPDKILRRAYRMYLGRDGELPLGSTGLRRAYNEAAHGWTSFDAWLDDWAATALVSRSSAWMKVKDIEAWRREGCDWPTVMNLLANVPMAAREAVTKPVGRAALPPGPASEEGKKADYLRELAALPPGQARKKVSEDAGEPQIYVVDSKFGFTAHSPARLLVLRIRVETSSGVEDYDLAVAPVKNSRREGWGAVALWISERLGRRIRIG